MHGKWACIHELSIIHWKVQPLINFYIWQNNASFGNYCRMGASMVKWTKLVLWYTKTTCFVLVKGLESSSKVLFKLDIFPMVTFVVLLNTQVHIIKLWSSKLIKSDAQEHIIKYGFEHKFDVLKCFEVGFSFLIPQIPWGHHHKKL